MTLDGATRSSSGGNTFSGNSSATDSTLDFHNLTAVTMMATGNCWNNNSNVAESITGPVTTSPTGACGSLVNSGTARGANLSGVDLH
jgi:hypothetical protein